jgi:hypothetical protein
MATLDDFTDTQEEPEFDAPPQIRKARPVPHPYKNHKIGKLVVVYNRGDEEKREIKGYRTTRTTDANLFRKFDSYPISLPVLSNLQFEEVELVLVYERDTKTLYEFTLDQYTADTTAEYDWTHYDDDTGREIRTDTQKCPAREDAVRKWDVTEWTKRDLFR